MPSSLTNKNVLLIATGSVAAIRVPLLAEQLQTSGAHVQVVHTSSAAHFLTRERALPEAVRVHTDDTEWRSWQRLGDPVLHIDLVKWADVLLFAPLSANSLAKLAAGICDNLALCVARAWPFARNRPFVVAPAMNVHMWRHPLTDEHLQKLRAWGVRVVMPVEKRLACGDVGVGAMEAPQNIVSAVGEMLERPPER